MPMVFWLFRGGGEGGGEGELIHLLNSLMMEVPAIKKPVY